MSEWFGVLPEHWELQRAKNLFQKENRPFNDNDEVVTCFRDGQVTLRKNRRLTGFTESTQWSGYQGVRKGDLVIHVMDAFAGAIGVSDSDGKCTPVYSCCTAIVSGINNDFYAYLLREMARAGWIQALYRGIRERSSDFRYEVFATQYLPLPPRTEQDQIVRYLDWKVSGINRLINAKKKQIALLGEQKRTVINEAVTRGGEGWRDISLGNLGDFRKGYGGSRADDDENGVSCIRYGDIYRSGVLSLTKPITRISAQAANSYARIYKSEILFALSGETKEEIGQSLINNIDEDAWCSGDAAIFTAGTEVLPRFLVYTLRCPYNVAQRASLAKGDIIVHISTGALRQLRVIVPPVPVQENIIADLDKKCSFIERAIEIEDRQITLLHEYRTRLISDVVTGKKDVSGIVVPEYELVEESASDDACANEEETEQEEE